MSKDAVKPFWSDAWILVALGWRPNPADILDALDQLNHSLPSDQMWLRSCAILGARGLIASGPAMPQPTALGRSILRQANPSGMFSRNTPNLVLERIRELPVVAAPVAPPSRDVLAEAAAELERRQRSWRKEQAERLLQPNLRDMGILVSLHLGIDSRTDRDGSDNDRPRPTHYDWQHLAGTLGRRGLIIDLEGRPKPTPKAKELIDALRSQAEGDRDLLRRLLVEVEALPVVFLPAAPPAPDFIRQVGQGPFWPWLLAGETSSSLDAD